MADRALQDLHRELVEHFPQTPSLSLVATGGYGRNELSPGSDVDLTIVPLDETAPELDAAVRWLFRRIHETFETDLGLAVGYAYRLVSDVPGLDAVTRTALMDARLVAGSSEPFERLMEELRAAPPVGDFLLAKLQEREQEMARHNDTPLAVEPELKLGAGGLRSHCAANWIRQAIGKKPLASTPAYDHILMMRNLLHATAGKRVDLLSRPRQEQLSDLLQLDMFEMCGKLAEALEANHADFTRAVQDIHRSRFSIAAGARAERGALRIANDTPACQAALAVSLAVRLGMTVGNERVRCSEVTNGPLAMAALARGEPTLRALDRCGALETLLPELARCRYLLPSDSSHSYTVFEHTLRAVRNLDQPVPYLEPLMAQMAQPSILYLATLLHDCGKAVRGAPHSQTGADLAAQLCRRWNLPTQTSETVEWLVREHLTMARFIQMRDVAHPKTAHEFAQQVQDVDRLRMLTVLTWADTHSVGPGTWSAVHEACLIELYEKTLAVLESSRSGDLASAEDTAAVRRHLLRSTDAGAVPEDALNAFLDSLPAHYLLTTTPDVIQTHFHLVQAALSGQASIQIRTVPEAHASELTVACPDSPGLLWRILAVLYASDLNLHALRACTTDGPVKVALDTFLVSFHERPLPLATANNVQRRLERVLGSEGEADRLLQETGKDSLRRQEIFTYTYTEGSPGILDITAPQGKGMAYRLARMIATQGWDILSARFGQWAGRGAAAFYITGADRHPISAEAVHLALGPQV
jgi:[protein-PII] uridylyltransferase